MLILNYWPLLHLASILLILCIPWAMFRWRLPAGLVLLYLLPPLLARVVRGVAPLREGRIAVGTPEFFTWWALLNLQIVFCRLPALEELLRMVPGLYSVWLRLWGASVGRLTYWAAGVQILDRSFVRIGHEVIFGTAVRINPHVLARNDHGELELILATVTVGDRAVVGGYSLLTAGTEIAEDECTRAFLISPPYGKWKGGTRISRTDGAR